MNNKIQTYIHSHFLDAINHFVQAKSVYRDEAKKSAPWKNLYQAYRLLLKWCEAIRDEKLRRNFLDELQSYLDKSPRCPILEYKLSYGNIVKVSDVNMTMSLRTGDKNTMEFDKDKDLEFGLLAVNDFADYLNGLGEGKRQKISDCQQCGKWFEWSGRGYENKFCSRKCRNRYNYLNQ